MASASVTTTTSVKPGARPRLRAAWVKSLIQRSSTDPPFRGASPLGLPYTRPRSPLRRLTPGAWLARVARSRDCLLCDVGLGGVDLGVAAHDAVALARHVALQASFDDRQRELEQ